MCVFWYSALDCRFYGFCLAACASQMINESVLASKRLSLHVKSEMVKNCFWFEDQCNLSFNFWDRFVKTNFGTQVWNVLLLLKWRCDRNWLQKCVCLLSPVCVWQRRKKSKNARFFWHYFCKNWKLHQNAFHFWLQKMCCIFGVANI